MRQRHTYFTRGVHNDYKCDPPESCLAERAPTDPSDPLYPAQWVSEWTMYRVFQGYRENPPPYTNPPATLSPSDYEVSTGATYYDAEFVPEDGDGEGAMMEYYEGRCLPIFPMSNGFSCAFVSLGNKAYFLRYDDRPAGTPECCQFSLDNHPPRRDFVKHLPYSAELSQNVDGTVQAYAYWAPAGPDSILFGYAFEKEPRPDAFDPELAPYRHPQSFFFSGFPGTPPDAPIVSQNYTNFRAEPPNPDSTWAQVGQKCTPDPEWCCLFSGDCPGGVTEAVEEASSWADMDARGSR